jgi:hypothetical protein
MSLPFRPQPKPESRLQQRQATKKLEELAERNLKRAVWERDKGHCRMCDRRVSRELTRVPYRGEVHHLHGRIGDLRYEPRAAILLCLADHERVTGRVAERWNVIGSKFWSLPGWTKLIDANARVRFERVA